MQLEVELPISKVGHHRHHYERLDRQVIQSLIMNHVLKQVQPLQLPQVQAGAANEPAPRDRRQS